MFERTHYGPLEVSPINRHTTCCPYSSLNGCPPSIEIASPSSRRMFVDASASDTLHTTLLCPTMVPDTVTRTYITTEMWPSTQAELLAVRDALLHTPALINPASPQCTIYTDPAAAVRALLKTLASNEVLLEIQDKVYTYPYRIRMSWRQRNTHPAMQAACRCRYIPRAFAISRSSSAFLL